MHQIKRKLILLQPWSKKLEILLFFRHAQCNPFTAWSFVRGCSLGKLEKGEAGEIDWVSLLFYTSVLTLSQMCEIFILSWLGILKIKMYRWLQKDFWQFSEEFWTLLKMSEDVPVNFESFQSYLKVTILACFVYGTLKLSFISIIHCRYTIFPGL